MIVCFHLLLKACVFGIVLGQDRSGNWTGASKAAETERELKYADHFKEKFVLCDMTEDVCDIRCCNDKDCTEAEKAAFPCLESENVESVCPWEEDWSSMFDCYKSNSPFLGSYYADKKRIKTLSSFEDLHEQQRYFFPQVERKSVPESASGYKFGQLLTTVLLFSKSDALLRRFNTLNLPTNFKGVSDNACVSFSPVKYLINRRDQCIRQVSQKTCQQNSVLHAATFAVLDPLYNSSSKYIFPQIFTNNSNGHVVNSSVKYLCLRKSTHHTALVKNLLLKTSVGFVTEDGGNIDYVEECSEDIMTAHFNVDSGLCHNVLVEVSHDFVWDGTNILRHDATYVVADVPILIGDVYEAESLSEALLKQKRNIFPHHETNESFVYVKQLFRVKFMHIGSAEMNDSESETSVPLVRSGNPGYDFGSPVLLVAESSNETSSFVENYLLLWNSGAIQLCKNFATPIYPL